MIYNSVYGYWHMDSSAVSDLLDCLSHRSFVRAFIALIHSFIQSISMSLFFAFCPWLRDSWKCALTHTHTHTHTSWTIFTMHFISMCASSIYQFDENPWDSRLILRLHSVMRQLRNKRAHQAQHTQRFMNYDDAVIWTWLNMFFVQQSHLHTHPIASVCVRGRQRERERETKRMDHLVFLKSRFNWNFSCCSKLIQYSTMCFHYPRLAI